MFNLGKEKMEVPGSWSFCPREKKGRETGRERVIVERAVMTSGVIVLRSTFYFIAYFLRHYIQFDSFKISEVGKLIYYLQLTLQTCGSEWRGNSGNGAQVLCLWVFIYWSLFSYTRYWLPHVIAREWWHRIWMLGGIVSSVRREHPYDLGYKHDQYDFLLWRNRFHQFLSQNPNFL